MTRFAFFGLLTVALALAQTATPPKGTGGSTPAPTPSIPRSPTTTLPTQSGDPNLSRTIFITGKVVMQDGTPPPESVVIERLCGSYRRAETHTDMKGNFSFQVGAGASNTEQMMDASSESSSIRGPLSNSSGATGGGLGASGQGGGRNSTDMRGCELRATLPGYQSSSVNLSMHSQFDSPDIGILILKRLAGREGDTISMTNALAPKDAKKAFDKSRQLLAKGDTVEAQKQLSKAVDIYPKYAAAWAELGKLQMDASDAPAARKSFERSLEADPRYLPPYERLAVLALRERKWDDLVDKTDKLIKLNAFDFPQAYYYNALANLNLNHSDLAEKSARQALKQDPQKFARAYYVLGLALAQKGDFAAAVEQLKSYLESAPPGATELDVVRKQMADIEKLATQQTAAKER